MKDRKNEKDEALCALAKEGDAAALEELMARHKGTVRRCARKFSLRLLAETDDLVQEGMIALYAAIGSYSPASGKSFKNFAYLCVLRRIYSYLRFVSRRTAEGSDVDPDSIAEGETPEELLLIGESDEEFRLRLMRALSDFEFRVVTMYLEGLSYAEISEATGKQIKSIDNALARAKRKLQRAFAES